MAERDLLDAEEPALTFSQLAQLAHDLKGPLSRVALETQVLESQLDDGDHVEMVHGIHRMLRNIDYLDRMVHDLIDSCALDGNRFTLHRKPTELCELLESVALQLAASTDRGRIVMDVRERVIVDIDALRIERVVANLLENALTYSLHGSLVVVRMEVAHGRVRVSVRDSGPGISTDEIGRIFDQYRRGLGTQAREGYGLGLFVSKQIVEAHGGLIGVRSAPGDGSEFYFELPLQQAP